MRRSLVAGALLAVVVATPAAAQVPLGSGFSVSGYVTGTTDYVTRGISQTRERPALQAGAELAHESGFYIGTFVSNVAFQGTDARQEVDAYLGYRWTLSGFRFDVVGQWYTYPGYTAGPGQYGLDFAEVILSAAYDFERVTLSGLVGWSPDYSFESGNAVRVEAGVAWTTPLWDIVLSGRVGYQSIDRNSRIGLPDYVYYGASVSKALGGGVSVAAGVYGTDISKSDCFGGRDVCDTRLLASVTWRF
ncbi:TorF family putative porin [Falsiroseomonas oryziterrae]|uniref:TorF family putative porin n=1 Tax=Falsiroseomonas oryziterrae TaxID=2911368 RepID=UPI001F0168D6|nr:TorF family putative porin [Roseomonas sp. NPKOSM-4]